MQLKSNLNHVFTSFSTKPPNNYRIFCGNKQIQSKYIYLFYDIIISPSHHPQASQKHRHPCARTNPPKTALSLAMHYILGSLVKGEVLSPEKIQATTGGIASPLSLAPHHILASLVKGRWIDGKAQTVALLLSACDMPTLFILQTFLPSRRRDCRTTIHRSHPTSPTQKIRHLH